MLVIFLIFYLLIFFFGAVLGSFFNVVIFRAVYETPPFWRGRSLCDQCGKKIAARDNIPIISYLALKGRCRHCQQKIPSLYFWTEILAGAYSVCFAYFASQELPLAIWTSAADYLFFLVLIFVVIADLKYLIIPDFFVAFLSVIVILAKLLGGGLASSLLAAALAIFFFLALYSIAKKILKKEALGLGDIKVMLPLALYLGYPKVLLAIFLSFILGGFFATILLLTKRKQFGQVLPFGPFLVIGFFLANFFAQELWSWYLSFLF